MRLQLSTWPEVEAYLKRSKGIIIPIGSTEQHGPTGMIGTDAICPEEVALGVAEKRDVLVGPTINIGVAQHHLGFPGSLTLRPSTLIAVVKDVVASLVKHGFSRIYFLNGHGGNIATIKAGFAEFYSELSLAATDRVPAGTRCRLFNWFAGKRAESLAQKLYGKSEGSHATPSEISLTWFAYPEAVKHVPLIPKLAPTGPIYDAMDYRQRFPDGRIGSDSALARIEHGERFFHASVEDVIEDYESFLEMG